MLLRLFNYLKNNNFDLKSYTLPSVSQNKIILVLILITKISKNCLYRKVKDRTCIVWLSASVLENLWMHLEELGSSVVKLIG